MKKIYSTLILAMLAFASFAQPCSKLFISEYVEGSGNNKAIEIYNPTINTVDLNGYSLIQYNNGADTARYVFMLSGSIAPGATYVYVNTQAATYIKDVADSISASPVFQFNGNDVIALLNGTDTLDRVGEIGVSTDIVFGDSTGLNHTYVRKQTVQEGSLDWATGNLEWDIYPRDTIRLGAHTMNPCSAPTDTLVNFTPTSYSFTGVNGSYNLTLSLNSNHDDVYTVDVEVLSGDPANINNFTTQTVTFASGETQKTVPITITNDTTGGQTNVIEFELTNETGGLQIGNNDVFTLTLNSPVVGPNSISDIEFSQFATLYPNPNKGQFVVETKNLSIKGIKLLDLAGRMVYASNEQSSGTIEINTSDILGGLYVVELSTNNGTLHTKVNIQK